MHLIAFPLSCETCIRDHLQIFALDVKHWTDSETMWSIYLRSIWFKFFYLARPEKWVVFFPASILKKLYHCVLQRLCVSSVYVIAKMMVRSHQTKSNTSYFILIFFIGTLIMCTYFCYSWSEGIFARWFMKSDSSFFPLHLSTVTCLSLTKELKELSHLQ